MKKYNDHIIDSISPTFCAAKWMQVTIDLSSGLGHSCHHTKKQKLSISDIQNNLSAFHNTEDKKKSRLLMLNGNRPPECDFCWKIEDLKQCSDRYIKSNDTWASKYIKHITDSTWDQDINPSYVEVMITNTCNFNCLYCSSDISSSIAKEIITHGEYPIQDLLFRSNQVKTKLKKSEQKELRRLFIQWLETAYTNLEYFRITGGEPLLSPFLYEIFDKITTLDNSKTVLAINSNFDPGEHAFNRFIQKTKYLLASTNIPKLEIYVSIDTGGDQAKFIRNGLNDITFFENIHYFMNTFPKVNIVIMVTFSILSFNNFIQLLLQVIKLKEKHANLTMDISPINNPPFLQVSLANDYHYEKFEECLDLMSSSQYFSSYEVSKFKRISHIMNNTPTNLSELRLTLINYLKEYSRRNNLSLISHYPDILCWEKEMI